MAGADFLLEDAIEATYVLERLEHDLPYFQTQMLPEFIVSRTKVVELVDELRKKIYNASMGGSGGRLAGAATGIVGGLATFVGIAMSLSGKANGASLMRAGNGLSLLGGATSASATLIELGFTHKYMKEIQQALKEDQRLANDIYPMIHRSRTLNLLLMRLFGYSILSENGRTVVMVCYECFRILRSGDRTINHLIREIQDDKVILGATDVITMTEEVARKVIECLRTLLSHPEMIQSYRTICTRLKDNPQVFELAKFSLQMYLQLRSVGGGLEAVASLLSLAGPEATSSGVLLAQGGFQTVMIALNFVSFIFAVKDIQSNKSKYCEHLAQIKEALAAELRVMMDLQLPAITS